MHVAKESRIFPAFSCQGVVSQAVVFVRDLDRSVLGLGGQGLEHYVKLRAATDIVVNSILRVRRLLKQKRTTNAGGSHHLLALFLVCNKLPCS